MWRLWTHRPSPSSSRGLDFAGFCCLPCGCVKGNNPCVDDDDDDDVAVVVDDVVVVCC